MGVASIVEGNPRVGPLPIAVKYVVASFVIVRPPVPLAAHMGPKMTKKKSSGDAQPEGLVGRRRAPRAEAEEAIRCLSFLGLCAQVALYSRIAVPDKRAPGAGLHDFNEFSA